MNFYIDFEATQPEQEIIEIGVVCENGNTFSKFVKPSHSKISPFITQLTGITNEQLEDEENLDASFRELYYWLEDQCSKIQEWKFYCYGSGDKDFLKKNLEYLKLEISYLMCCVLIARMSDFSAQTKNYFRGNISLIDAFNYVCKESIEQQHNALQDAVMLNTVAKKIDGKKALAEFPFNTEQKHENEDEKYCWPKGRFACYSEKGKTLHYFETCQEAVNWVIQHSAPTVKVYKSRVAKRIMKAIRKQTLYAGYYWTRRKKE